MGGSFFQQACLKGHILLVDWLVPGARPGEIATLSTIPTNPVPPLTCWGPAEHGHRPHGMMHASGACLEGASLPSNPPLAAIFFLPVQDETSWGGEDLQLNL